MGLLVASAHGQMCLACQPISHCDKPLVGPQTIQRVTALYVWADKAASTA